MTANNMVCVCDSAVEGVEAEVVCERFLAAASDAGRDDIERIEVTVLSSVAAKAVALDREGDILAQLDFDVMDAELRPAIWDRFADDFRRHLEAAT